MTEVLEERGYLTMAVGSRDHLEMAVDLALSLRRWTELPIALGTDATLKAIAHATYPEVFHRITLVDDRFTRIPKAMKFGAASASPFQETLFIDADSLILADPSPIWEAAGESPITVIGELLDQETELHHHGFPVRWLMEQFGLDHYLKTNSGLFHLRREGAPEYFEECLAFHKERVLPLRNSVKPWRLLGDEFAIAAIGARRGFARFEPLDPMYWGPELKELDLDHPHKPILHFIAPIHRKALRRLLEEVEERRQEKDFRVDVSGRIWRRKNRRSAASVLGNRLLEFISMKR